MDEPRGVDVVVATPQDVSLLWADLMQDVGDNFVYQEWGDHRAQAIEDIFARHRAAIEAIVSREAADHALAQATARAVERLPVAFPRGYDHRRHCSRIHQVTFACDDGKPSVASLAAILSGESSE